MKNKLLLLVVIAALKTNAQCINNTINVYSFVLDDVPYNIVKEKKTWVNAAACAVSLGGKLAEINSKAEQDTIFYHLNQANIPVANTIAPDGGNGSYVWLGGHDISTEGKWVWDGANSGSTNQFWQGTSTGSAVAGSYSNWGNEPDNWTNQDALGLAVTNWPLGQAGQWNDIKETNQLYYIIEYPKIITTTIKERNALHFSSYPNPAEDIIVIEPLEAPKTYVIRDGMGRTLKSGQVSLHQKTIDLTELSSGIYYLSIDTEQKLLIKK